MAVRKRDRASCMASARGAVQGEEEAGERPQLGVWEVGDPRGRRGCREPLWEWGLGSQSHPACSPWPLTLLTSFLNGLSTRGLVMSPYESFLEPHSHLDEQSQAKRPPRWTVSARGHPRSRRSSDAPSRMPARLLRASCARLRDFRSPPCGWSRRRLDWCPARRLEDWKTVSPFICKSKLDPGTARRGFQCTWSDSLRWYEASKVSSLQASKPAGWSQSKKNTQLWMWLVIEARSDAVKSNIA